MKIFKKLVSLFLCTVFFVCICLSSGMAFESYDYSNMESEEIYNILIEQTKSDFLDSIYDICDSGGIEAIIASAVALNDRPDVSVSELVEMITDKNNSTTLRQIALESYSKRTDALHEGIISMISDSSDIPSLQALTISFLSDRLTASETQMLVNKADSVDADLAYNAMKALESIAPEQAVSIATSIYDNYENEMPARINIAAKILSRALTNNNTSTRAVNEVGLSEQEFVDQSMTIIENTENDEIHFAISKAIEPFSSGQPLAIAEPRAAGYQGYAAYRDGVAGIEWHGAIIYGPETSRAYFIFAQATGVGYTADLVNYPTFEGNGSPKGYYRPKSTSLSSSKRDAVCDTALELVNEHIGYCFGDPMTISSNITTSKIYPSDITGLRCDGLIEYCYEFNNVRVFGSVDAHDSWNISLNNNGYSQSEHAGFSMTPKRQAENYMTRLGSI